MGLMAHALAVVCEMATLLQTGLDRDTLHLCAQLLHQGINPEALAAVVKELRREAAAVRRTGATARPN